MPTLDKHSSVSVEDAIVTGGETRSDGRASFGYALLRGKRPHQEDFASAQFHHLPGDAGEQVGLFGVFDGHGGPGAADFVHTNLFRNLMQHRKLATDTYAAIAEVFEQTDEEYLNHPSLGRDDGCTAVTAVLMGQRLLVANVGDSRAVLSRGGKAIPLSIDHKPNLREERTRIEGAGGVVIWLGTWRVGGVLAVSRSFGDRPLKRFVIPTPYIQEESLTERDDCIILASDGVWDVISNQEAVSLVGGISDAGQAARRLVQEAFRRGSPDNISAVLIKLRF